MARAANRFGATRVAAASVSARLDAIQALLELDYAQALYRYVSAKTGIHATTLLRYHLGRLQTAPYTLNAFLLRLEQEIAVGRHPVLKGRLRRQPPGASHKKGPCRRVSNNKVRRLLLQLMERLRVPPHMFYRQVGAAVGLHPVTVFRHADGQLATAPLRLFEYLRDMGLALDSGREVVFTRAKLGTRVVPREFVVEEIQRLMKMRAFPSQRSLLRFVAASLGMKPRALEGACSSRERVFLPEEVLKFLRALIARVEYVPEARYEVGDRIFHPDFGCGVVVSKEPKDRLVVALADGSRQVFRERLIELREWARRESWSDGADASSCSEGR